VSVDSRVAAEALVLTLVGFETHRAQPLQQGSRRPDAPCTQQVAGCVFAGFTKARSVYSAPVVVEGRLHTSTPSVSLYGCASRATRRVFGRIPGFSPQPSGFWRVRLGIVTVTQREECHCGKSMLTIVAESRSTARCGQQSRTRAAAAVSVRAFRGLCGARFRTPLRRVGIT
jgi:hypothetical protein